MSNSSKKALQAAFRDATFDPRQPGPISTITSSNKVGYLIERAQEVLRDSERFLGTQKRARIRDAVSILAYAMTLLPVEVSAHKPCAFKLCKHSWGNHRGLPGDSKCQKYECTCLGYQDPDVVLEPRVASHEANSSDIH